ncbi:hypothetical protein BD410DRAFT_801469 [Rickenella mellea]|uniref:Uncharacterized protein n=1 Tax=Rickenella mellea TaxID=50990 RepID=A0A4Y7QF12_9AGAM|nr:hypothetical protein BD410DRAFT_801469 [Rickenella mellea]
MLTPVQVVNRVADQYEASQSGPILYADEEEDPNSFKTTVSATSELARSNVSQHQQQLEPQQLLPTRRAQTTGDTREDFRKFARMSQNHYLSSAKTSWRLKEGSEEENTATGKHFNANVAGLRQVMVAVAEDENGGGRLRGDGQSVGRMDGSRDYGGEGGEYASEEDREGVDADGGWWYEWVELRKGESRGGCAGEEWKVELEAASTRGTNFPAHSPPLRTASTNSNLKRPIRYHSTPHPWFATSLRFLRSATPESEPDSLPQPLAAGDDVEINSDVDVADVNAQLDWEGRRKSSDAEAGVVIGSDLRLPISNSSQPQPEWKTVMLVGTDGIHVIGYSKLLMPSRALRSSLHAASFQSTFMSRKHALYHLLMKPSNMYHFWVAMLVPSSRLNRAPLPLAHNRAPVQTPKTRLIPVGTQGIDWRERER